MSIVDLAGDWKSANADRLVEVTVEACDPDDGPEDDDERAEKILALQGGIEEGPVRVQDGEVNATTCDWEFCVVDVGFAVKQRMRLTDTQGLAWVFDSVRKDASGALWRTKSTLTRGT